MVHPNMPTWNMVTEGEIKEMNSSICCCSFTVQSQTGGDLGIYLYCMRDRSGHKLNSASSLSILEIYTGLPNSKGNCPNIAISKVLLKGRFDNVVLMTMGRIVRCSFCCIGKKIHLQTKMHDPFPQPFCITALGGKSPTLHIFMYCAVLSH